MYRHAIKIAQEEVDQDTLKTDASRCLPCQVRNNRSIDGSIPAEDLSIRLRISVSDRMRMDDTHHPIYIFSVHHAHHRKIRVRAAVLWLRQDTASAFRYL